LNEPIPEDVLTVIEKTTMWVIAIPQLIIFFGSAVILFGFSIGWVAVVYLFIAVEVFVSLGFVV
jgi:hypothetical protein